MAIFRFWLQDQLHDKGWTGSEFARRIKMSVPTVNFWLAGANLPSKGAVPKIARELGASEQDIWDMILERSSPQYGDAVSRALNLPPDLTVQEARYLHLAHRAFRTWLGEVREGGTAQSGEQPA